MFTFVLHYVSALLLMFMALVAFQVGIRTSGQPDNTAFGKLLGISAFLEAILVFLVGLLFSLTGTILWVLEMTQDLTGTIIAILGVTLYFSLLIFRPKGYLAQKSKHRDNIEELVDKVLHSFALGRKDRD